MTKSSFFKISTFLTFHILHSEKTSHIFVPHYILHIINDSQTLTIARFDVGKESKNKFNNSVEQCIPRVPHTSIEKRWQIVCSKHLVVIFGVHYTFWSFLWGPDNTFNANDHILKSWFKAHNDSRRLYVFLFLFLFCF